MRHFTDKLEATAKKYAEILLNADSQVNDMKAISEKAAELAYSWHEEFENRQYYYNAQQPYWIAIYSINENQEEDEGFNELANYAEQELGSSSCTGFDPEKFYWIVDSKTKEVKYAQYSEGEREDEVMHRKFKSEENSEVIFASHYLPYDTKISPSIPPLPPKDLNV